jgi:S-adenosylmethionine/arginine decarboxylase-like enzyme
MFWGKLATINLYGCDPGKIKNKKIIADFLKELCKKIDMKPYGKPQIKRFGEADLEGYSALQFIETSSITIHFDETENRAFIDIFSCKDFNAKEAEKFSKEFFNAKKSKKKTMIRR